MSTTATARRQISADELHPPLPEVKPPEAANTSVIENAYVDYRINDTILNSAPHGQRKVSYRDKVHEYMYRCPRSPETGKPIQQTKKNPNFIRDGYGSDADNASFRVIAKNLLGCAHDADLGYEGFQKFFQLITGKITNKDWEAAVAKESNPQHCPTDLHFTPGSVYDVLSHINKLVRLAKAPLNPGNASESFYKFRAGFTDRDPTKLKSFANGIITHGKYATINLLESIRILEQKLSAFAPDQVEGLAGRTLNAYLDAMSVPRESWEAVKPAIHELARDMQSWLEPIKDSVIKFAQDPKFRGL